jgi:hypothetical protein
MSHRTWEGDDSRMTESDLSGKDIPHDQEVQISVILGDGIRRHVTVSNEEASRLAAQGRVPKRRDRLLAILTKPLAWLLALAVTTLVFPALVKQWTDRPKELEAKSAIIQGLSEVSSDSIQWARFLASGTFPEAVVRKQICLTADTTAGTPEDVACRAARSEERKAEASIFTQKVNTWATKGAALQSRLAVEFEDESLSSNAKEYVIAVERFIRLASRICGFDRDGTTKYVLDYLEEPEDEYAPLFELTDKECRDKSTRVGFLPAYRRVAERLLTRRDDLLEPVVQADMRGFSFGYRDFLDDVGAAVGLIILALALLLLLLSVRKA